MPGLDAANASAALSGPARAPMMESGLCGQLRPCGSSSSLFNRSEAFGTEAHPVEQLNIRCPELVGWKGVLGVALKDILCYQKHSGIANPDPRITFRCVCLSQPLSLA